MINQESSVDSEDRVADYRSQNWMAAFDPFLPLNLARARRCQCLNQPSAIATTTASERGRPHSSNQCRKACGGCSERHCSGETSVPPLAAEIIAAISS